MTAHDGHAGHEDALARLLELDALVMRPYLDEATLWAAQLGPAQHLVDLGAGVGASTVALAQVFPQASVVAVDTSADMLARVSARAALANVADRVSTVEIDLNRRWPELEAIDVAWVSSVLHELEDPEAALANLAASLTPGGRLIVVEMDAPPSFLPDASLEKRIHDLLRTLPSGRPAHPDWTAHIESAGLEMVERRTFVINHSPDDQRSAGEFANAYLERVRPHVVERLTATDREALDELLAPSGPRSLRRRTDLRVRGARTALAARA